MMISRASGRRKKQQKRSVEREVAERERSDERIRNNYAAYRR